MAASSRSQDASMMMTNTNSMADVLRAQLAEKDLELKRIREELHKATAQLQQNNHTSSSSSTMSMMSLPPTPSSSDVVESKTQDDRESLRKQLNEATARWRWEERRAKAREEELEQTANSERTRADAIAKDLEALKAELTQTKDKVREATRKRAQMQAEQTALKTDMEAIKAKTAETEKALELSENTVKETFKALSESQARIKELEASMEDLRTINEQLEKERSDLKNAASERDAALERLTKMESQLAASEERALALKQTMRHNAQLVKDLKAELSKSMSHTPAPSPYVAPLSPVTPSGNQHQPVPSPSKDEMDGLVKELAGRLERLLSENGGLHERIRFLEDIVQGLTADLNRATGKSPGLSPRARPSSIRHQAPQ